MRGETKTTSLKEGILPVGSHVTFQVVGLRPTEVLALYRAVVFTLCRAILRSLLNFGDLGDEGACGV